MAPITRQEHSEVLEHIQRDIAQFKDDDPEVLALKQHNFRRLQQFIGIGTDTISTWTYDVVDENNNITTTPFMLAHISVLKHLVHYVRVIVPENNNQPSSVDVCKTYHNDHFLSYMANPSSRPVTPPSTAAVTTSSSPSSVFKKGNKRDMSLYPELKDITHYSSWKLAFDALHIRMSFVMFLMRDTSPPKQMKMCLTYRSNGYLLSSQRH